MPSPEKLGIFAFRLCFCDQCPLWYYLQGDKMDLYEKFKGRKSDLVRIAKNSVVLGETLSRTLIGEKYIGKFYLVDTYENRFKLGQALINLGNEKIKEQST
jgi:hypothetical protein